MAHTPDEGDRLISVGEAARRLGVSTQTIRNWLTDSRHDLTAVRTLGGHYRLHEAAVDALLAGASTPEDAA